VVVEMDISFNDQETPSFDNGIIRLKADVSSEKSMEECAQIVGKHVKKLDVVISNAGIFDFYALSESGINGLKRIFDVNFFGFSNTVKYFLPFLVKSEGRLVTISSESYKIPAPFQPYAISKQALEKLHFGISQELMLKGISTVLIRPGAIQTNILKETVAFKNPDSDSMFIDEFKKFTGSVPKYIAKVSAPKEVAKLVFRAATSKNPKRIYKINHNPWVSLLAALPNKLQDWSIKRQLKVK
jgi:NAD(P)-dependent dehydrogenase (short-subunit alcohol dehydrogenase family)